MVKQRIEGEGSGADLLDVEGLLGRVAARQAHLEGLSQSFRVTEAETVARARQWPSGLPVPAGVVTEAAQALAGGSQVASRPWLTGRQLERLRRAERRYAHHAAHRPAGSPPAPAAVLLDLFEHAPGAVEHPLAWAVAQLDLLSKRMRRDRRRAEPPPLLRRRAARRQDRTAASAGAFFRRRGNARRDAALETVVDHLADGLCGRRGWGEKSASWEALEHQLREVGHLPPEEQLKARERRGGRETAAETRGFRWRWLDSPSATTEQLGRLVPALHAVGVGLTAEQLRTQVRDRVLLAGGEDRLLEQLKRPDGEEPYTPDSYDPAGPQLTERDLQRSHEWAWRRNDRGDRGRARTTAAVSAASAPRSVGAED